MCKCLYFLQLQERAEASVEQRLVKITNRKAKQKIPLLRITSAFETRNLTKQGKAVGKTCKNITEYPQQNATRWVFCNQAGKSL